MTFFTWFHEFSNILADQEVKIFRKTAILIKNQKYNSPFMSRIYSINNNNRGIAFYVRIY